MTHLTEEQIAQFHRDGFLSLPQFLDPATLDMAREHYEAFLRGEIEGAEDRQLGGLIRQIMVPSKKHPFFRDNQALRSARLIAAQLNGRPEEEVTLRFDMMIDKPPLTPNQTPWHQDFAYVEQPFAPAGVDMSYPAVQFWIALDDVDESNGCMQFIPGVHTKPMLPHRIASGAPDDPSRLLQTDDVDVSQAVKCPLPAGGCTIHTYGTPHFTDANVTPDKRRRAYIMNVG
jgi:ectoine hydroxylase-related dioxygenase (phytanoyl-CoA dioxygenase family)